MDAELDRGTEGKSETDRRRQTQSKRKRERDRDLTMRGDRDTHRAKERQGGVTDRHRQRDRRR